MTYHISKLSLNQFLIESTLSDDETASIASDMCAASVDAIVSIVEKYKSQDILRSMPLLFVQGIILALDFADTHGSHAWGCSPTNVANSDVLDYVLRETASVWQVACVAWDKRRAILAESQKRSYGSSTTHFLDPDEHEAGLHSLTPLAMPRLSESCGTDLYLYTAMFSGRQDYGTGMFVPQTWMS